MNTCSQVLLPHKPQYVGFAEVDVLRVGWSNERQNGTGGPPAGARTLRTFVSAAVELSNRKRV